jgi:uncharacterized metal-binding protein
MKCAVCDDKDCYDEKDCTSIKNDVVGEYAKKENKRIIRAAAAIESEGYMKFNRLEEVVLFCKEMDFTKLGLAFCIGLEDEARLVHEVLSKDFEVSSVCCKVCALKKKDFRLQELEGGGKSACNPIGQATVLNNEKTELNLILGLCIGHDILFTEYSDALVTTLAVKDRVLAHNPLGAIYSKYYRKRRFGLK